MASRFKPLIKKQYLCGACDDVHEWKTDAEECCAPVIDSVYLCPVCNEVHFSEESAVKCHDFDPDLTAIIITAAEKEAHGQLRIESF